tara:strand:+ start:2353 stop:2787 length:435 start_codon:yes stop_codon:yes gene_type:complete
LSRSGALNRIDTLLGTVSDPTFTAVLRGEPLALAGSPTAAFWIAGREVDFLTLKDVSSITEITIRAYFRMQPSAVVREDLELNIWDAIVNIDTALRSDSDLDGNITDMEIGSATTGYSEIGGLAFRTLDIPLSLTIMGEVTITP